MDGIRVGSAGPHDAHPGHEHTPAPHGGTKPLNDAADGKAKQGAGHAPRQ